MGRPIRAYTPSVAVPRYFGIVNGLAMSIYGVMLYYASGSVFTFGLSLAAVTMIMLAVLTEAYSKGGDWLKESIIFVSLGFPMIFIGYLFTPYVFDPLFKVSVDLAKGSARSILGLIDPSKAMLLFPVVALAIPLVVEGIATFIRSGYVSAVLSLLGYPILVNAICVPLAVFLVSFVVYIYVGYFVYVISMAVAASVLILINLLDALAVYAGLAILVVGNYALARVVPDIAFAVSDAITGLATYEPDLDFRDSYRRFLALNIVNYIIFGVLGYSYIIEAYSWVNVMSMAMTMIVASEISIMVFYMLRNYPRVSPRLVRRVVYLANALEGMAMVWVVFSGLAPKIVYDSAMFMFNTLKPFYREVIDQIMYWIFKPL
jgi:hypothetical protein